MQSAEYHALLEAALKRPLTPAEEKQLQAYWASHPEAQASWEEEMGLNRLLRQLPDAPLASNFTAQVLQAAERESSRSPLLRPVSWWLRPFDWSWAQSVAGALLVLSLSLLLYHQHQLSLRAERARSVAAVSGFATLFFGDEIAVSVAARNGPDAAAASAAARGEPLPPLELLENFEAINRLSQVSPQVDLELLAALQ
ncbi:MAG: hypothetical protein HY674_11450 [Chloroflexi bacterium]|nr:hypothetical protein [Chloroflexota bacterium]